MRIPKTVSIQKLASNLDLIKLKNKTLEEFPHQREGGWYM
jgi:hypothetical protein